MCLQLRGGELGRGVRASLLPPGAQRRVEFTFGLREGEGEKEAPFVVLTRRQ